jgi:hypothetical protein
MKAGGPLWFNPRAITTEGTETTENERCRAYNEYVEKKIFWAVFTILSLVALMLPAWWGLLATIPIAYASWWVAYRSDWFN